jgi:hypothetical protein
MIIEAGIKYLKKGTEYQFCYYCISDLIHENVTQYFFEYKKELPRFLDIFHKINLFHLS